MPAVIDCPSCNRKLNLPDDLLGREVRCPGCKFTFTVTPASEMAVPPLRPVLVREEAPPSRPPAPARLGAGRIGVANGLGMLLYQGAKALEIWTGQAPPVAVMRDALEKNIYG